MSLGVSLDYYWGDITPAYFFKLVQAHQLQVEEKLMLLDQSNFLLGQYIARAVSGVLGNRNSYPKEPFLVTAKKRNERFRRVLSDAEVEELLANNRKEKGKANG